MYLKWKITGSCLVIVYSQPLWPHVTHTGHSIHNCWRHGLLLYQVLYKSCLYTQYSWEISNRIPTLRWRKLRHREVEQLPQGHTASKRLSHDLNTTPTVFLLFHAVRPLPCMKHFKRRSLIMDLLFPLAIVSFYWLPLIAQVQTQWRHLLMCLLLMNLLLPWIIVCLIQYHYFISQILSTW